MANLADVSGKQRIDQLQLLYHLESWDQCSDVEKEAFVHKAKEACQLVCDVKAPHDGEVLFQAVQQKKNLGATTDAGLDALVAAYRKAPSKILKTQFLSIYANRFTVKELNAIHRPFENLSDRQIKKVGAHSSSEGPGIPITKIPQHLAPTSIRMWPLEAEYLNLL